MENSPRQPGLRQESVNSSCKHPESKNILGFAGQMVSVGTAQLGLVARSQAQNTQAWLGSNKILFTKIGSRLTPAYGKGLRPTRV